MLFGLVLVLFAVLSVAVDAAFKDTLNNALSTVKNLGPVVVNTLLITGAIYLLLTMVFKIDMSNMGNKWIMYGIIAVIVCLLVLSPVFGAAKGSKVKAMEKIPWVWDYNFLGEFKFFLWGTENGVQKMGTDGKPMGILKNPTRLGVFVGALLVFIWLFDFLKVGGESEQAKLKYIFAFVIAYGMVNQLGMGIHQVIIAGQLVGVFVIQRQVKEVVGDNALASFGLSALLMLAIGYIAFPNYDNMLNNWLTRGIGGIFIAAIMWVVAFAFMTKKFGGKGKFGAAGLSIFLVGLVLWNIPLTNGLVNNGIAITIGSIVAAVCAYVSVNKYFTAGHLG